MADFRIFFRMSIFTLTLLHEVRDSRAQDIENITEQKPVRINGGINANTTFYHASGIANRRDPFYWLINANLNFNILGVVQAPFSMTISQQQKRFSQPQPFNRFGMSPRYKGITAHLGYRTMNFSEYTLAGQMFLGAGIEVVPKASIFRFSAMYGRLAKAVERAAQAGLVFARPTYLRRGYGFKVGIAKNKQVIDLILFRGWDDETSITVTPELDVTPEANLVSAIHASNQINDRLDLDVEYAYSLYTRDITAIASTETDYSFANNLGGLFRPNLSSEFNHALTTTLNYNAEKYQANIRYRRIDPGYRTLGSAFLNNGMRDMTAGLSWRMAKQKVNVSTNGGIQESLDESVVRRGVYSINITYNPKPKLVTNFSYSNFSSATRKTQIQTELLNDTLQFVQITRSGTANINYAFGPDNDPRNLTLTVSAQTADGTDQPTSKFLNGNLSYQMKFSEFWQTSFALAANRNETIGFETTSFGPVGNIGRSWKDGAVRSNLSIARLSTYNTDMESQNSVLNVALSNSVKVAKSNTASLQLYFLDHEAHAENARSFREVRFMFNYGYSF